jgi:hypothetical protein
MRLLRNTLIRTTVAFLLTVTSYAETITIFDSNATIGPGDSYDTVVVKGDGTVVTMTGGDANTVITMNASTFKMTGGDLNDVGDMLIGHDSSSIEILGGDVRYIVTCGHCGTIVSGNSAIHSIECQDQSNLRVSSQNAAIYSLIMAGSSNLDFLEGTVQSYISQYGAGRTDISGGTINNFEIWDYIGSDGSLYISGGQISTLSMEISSSRSDFLIRISGGSIDILEAYWFDAEADDVKIEILGYDLDALPYGGVSREGQITGYWHNDVYFSIDLGWQGIYDHVILYDGTMPTDCVDRPDSDLTDDCRVNLYDLGKLSSEWLDCGLDPNDACWE